MKKGWILVVVAAVAFVGIGAVTARPAETVTVTTMRLQPQKVEQTVTCSGVVESAGSVGVFAPVSCVLGEITAQKGAFVKAGEVLAYVDKEATHRAGLVTGQKEALLLAGMGDTLTAPEDGVIIRVEGKPGTELVSKSPCVVLAPLSALQVRVAIREKQLRTLREGMPVRVSGAGFAGKSYEGTLTEISATAKSGGGETVVEGVVALHPDQTDASLRLGLTAKAAVVVSSTEKGLVVPYAAVLEDENNREYVYILQDGVAHRQPLSVKEEVADGLLLADDVLAGAEIITQPELVPADGAVVTAAGKETA